jgi:hypothetical protein
MPKLTNNYPYKVTKSQYEYVFNLLNTRGFTKILKSGRVSFSPTCKAYCYILYLYIQRFKILQRKTDGWLFLGKDNLNTRFESWECKKLLESGILDCNIQFRPGIHSAKYRIPDEILQGWTSTKLESDYVNLMSGKPWTEADNQNLQREQSVAWQGYPERMRQAAEMFQESRFNHIAIEAHLERLREELSFIPPNDERHKTKAAALRNDELCYNAILSQNATPSDSEGYRTYEPYYLPNTTGRISVKGGGFQSCSREMKLAAFGNLPGMLNYDLKSSQARICLYYAFPKYGIESAWLEEYVQSEQVRKACSEYIGIPNNVWKQCLSALLMGGDLPSLKKDRDILKTFKREVSTDQVVLEGIIKRLREVVKTLMPSLNKWQKAITEQLEKDGRLMNAMGLELTKESANKSKSKRGKIAAHILQGAEALIIQELTLLGPEYGYKSIENQHDGLVIVGKEIPDKVIEWVKKNTKMDFWELDTKQDFGAEKV